MNKHDRAAFLERGKAATATQDPPPFTEKEFIEYQEAAKHIAEAYPEVTGNKAAQEMADAGFDMHPVVLKTLIKNRKPEVTAWLLSERGRADAHALLNVKDDEKRTLAELERIQSRVERQGAFQRPVVRTDEVARTDDYIRHRKADIRAGLRGVR